MRRYITIWRGKTQDDVWPPRRRKQTSIQKYSPPCFFREHISWCSHATAHLSNTAQVPGAWLLQPCSKSPAVQGKKMLIETSVTLIGVTQLGFRDGRLGFYLSHFWGDLVNVPQFRFSGDLQVSRSCSDISIWLNKRSLAQGAAQIRAPATLQLHPSPPTTDLKRGVHCRNHPQLGSSYTLLPPAWFVACLFDQHREEDEGAG